MVMIPDGLIQKSIDDKLRRDNEEKFFGLWPGIVEFSHDPWILGRLKVRVPTIHKGYDTIKTEDLPWAYKKELTGGAFDFGSVTNYPIGADVWVSFINGDLSKPVVEGSYHMTPAEQQIHGQYRDYLLPVDAEDSALSHSMGPAVHDPEENITRGQTQVPQELRRTAFNEPTISIPFKSWKGAGIVVEDREAQEYFEMLDRSGQGLRMESRITKEKNKHNAFQRGLRSVFRGDQFDYKEDTENRESTVSLRDLSQQGLLLEAKDKEERVKLQSKKASGDDNGTLDFDMGGTVHSIELGAGHSRTVIEGRQQNELRFRISFDSQRGIIDIHGDLSVQVSADKIAIRGQRIVLEGDVVIDGNLTVSGSEVVVGEQVSGSLERDKPINYT